MSHKYPCIYYDNGKCQKFSDDHYTAWCDFDNCEHQTPSIADYIRSLSDEDLAELMHEVDKREGYSYLEAWIERLKEPYKEDT